MLTAHSVSLKSDLLIKGHLGSIKSSAFYDMKR